VTEARLTWSHEVTETRAPRLRSGRPEQSRRTERVPLIRGLPAERPAGRDRADVEITSTFGCWDVLVISTYARSLPARSAATVVSRGPLRALRALRGLGGRRSSVRLRAFCGSVLIRALRCLPVLGPPRCDE
jgi:hypothetical protein